MSTTRIKQPAAVWVPQTREDVANAIAEIGVNQRERARIQADMNDALAATREGFEAQAKPHADRIKELSDGIKLWCEVNRALLTDGDKRKTHAFDTGEVCWRLRPPSVVVRAVDEVLKSLRALGLTRFIRTREEVNKEAVLLEPEVARQVRGISISQAEDFVIKPWDTQLEEQP